MKYSRLKIVLCIVLLLAAATGVQAQLMYCFHSTDGNNLKLKFTLIDKDWKYGFIQYNDPEYGIFIRQKYNHSVDSYNSPGLHEYMWEEVRNDTVTGTYQFMIQAESISDFIYTRAVDKKQFKFAVKGIGKRDCECDW